MSETTERTISETVMTILEDFGGAEPIAFIAVWLDSNGDIAMSRTHQKSSIQYLGLLEAAKLMVGKYFLATPPRNEQE